MQGYHHCDPGVFGKGVDDRLPLERGGCNDDYTSPGLAQSAESQKRQAPAPSRVAATSSRSLYLYSRVGMGTNAHASSARSVLDQLNPRLQYDLAKRGTLHQISNG